MLHPPLHSWVGGTAGWVAQLWSRRLSLLPLLELLSGPWAPARGGHQSLQILALCLNGLGSLRAVPGGAASRSFPRNPGTGTMPAPGCRAAPQTRALPGAAAFSADVLNVSCSSCPSLLGLERSSWQLHGDHGPGTPPWLGTAPGGWHQGLWQVQAGLGLPPGLLFLEPFLELLSKREFPRSFFYCSHLFMTLM